MSEPISEVETLDLSEYDLGTISAKTILECARGAAVIGALDAPGATERDREKNWKNGFARLLALRKMITKGIVREVNGTKMTEQVFYVGEQKFSWPMEQQFPDVQTFARIILAVNCAGGMRDAETI